MARGMAPRDILIRTVRERLVTVEPTIRAYRWLPDRLAGDLDKGHRKDVLSGVPMAVKDLMDVAGMPTTGGSAAYHWVPTEDAPAVGALRAAGAWIVGKSNTRELAFGVTCPPTVNPWGVDRIAGGSSGGSAAALAAGLAWCALGTDTAGSIRIPAACCGVVGFKPSTGAVDVSGVMPLSWTLDHVGPLARSAQDAARLFALLTGDAPVLAGRPPGRVWVPREYLDGWMDAEVAGWFETVLERVARQGVDVKPLTMEPFSDWVEVFRAIRLPEAFAYHRPLLESGRSEDLGAGLAERLREGRDVKAYLYVDALRRRRAWRQAWAARLGPDDQIWMPTLPVGAPPLDADPIVVNGRAQDLWSALVRFTLPWNVLGWPAVSVPVGLQAEGLPVGVQMVGAEGSDARVLQAAMWWETMRGAWPFPAGGFRRGA